MIDLNLPLKEETEKEFYKILPQYSPQGSF